MELKNISSRKWSELTSAEKEAHINSPLGVRKVKLWDELTMKEKDGFTMGGRVKREDWWRDESVSEFIHWKKEYVDEYVKQANERKTQYYGITDSLLYECLNEYSIKNKSVAVLGSQTPWYEAIVISYGGIPTTIEYNKIKTDDDDRLKTMTVDEYMQNPTEFDFAVSISSFEHSGLGRYGDTIDPDGDLDAMRNVGENILKKDGILFLSVPMGVDKCWFNVHRVYGKIRWPKLIDGFEMIASCGIEDDTFKNDTGQGVYQPVAVLKNNWRK